MLLLEIGGGKRADRDTVKVAGSGKAWSCKFFYIFFANLPLARAKHSKVCLTEIIGCEVTFSLGYSIL